MASLFKPRITRYLDENGRRTRKDVPGARRVREKSRKWYGEYRDMHGVLQRVPLATDKSAAQAMLNDIVRRVEQRQAGLFDPYEEHAKRPLSSHLDDYERFLRAKDNSAKHVGQTIGRIRRLAAGCEFERLAQIDATKVATWLSDQRATADRFSAQTSNFYLDAFKYFCNWLAKHERIAKNPVASLGRVNISTDRRHDRRSLHDDEFRRLLAAAESGGSIEGLSGPDRAMMYLMAAWTGFRRRELSSLTLRSLDLTSESPAVHVEAAYSKRRRQDAIPLHSYVTEQLQDWLAEKNLGPNEPLFVLTTPKGHFRKTAKMMKRDLAEAKRQWTEEAETDEERERRETSDFLSYQDEAGLFADFHANRHTFISNLGRAGVSLATAQKLARHSDPRLTANRYMHLDIEHQAAAIQSLPSPNDHVFRSDVEPSKPPISKPTDQTLVAGMVAVNPVADCPAEATNGSDGNEEPQGPPTQKPLPGQGLGSDCQHLTPNEKVHPRGFAPLTFGSVDRCSIQLS